METESWGAEDRLRRVVLSGPESSGKTTLAKQLASEFGCLWVPEFARDYLEIKGSSYQFEDLLLIANGQRRMQEILELKARVADHSLLFLDTDLLTLKIWSEYRFQKVDPIITQIIDQEKAANLTSLHILCSPDIPWESDPLRENEGDRSELFAIYEKELIQSSSPYITVSGTVETRLQLAITEIESLLSTSK